MTAAAVAVTGGIGAGKSTVCRMFVAQGIPVLDLDRVGHQLLTEDQSLQAQIINAYGKAVTDQEGRIHRPSLAALVFQDAGALAHLNSLMHPRIRQRELQWRHQQITPFVIIEASVLIESGQHQRMDAVIAVLAPLAQRKQRTLRRHDYDESRFAAIVARQCNDEQRRQYADYILENNSTLQALQTAQHILYNKLCATFS